ncbi:5-carboxymethyl-2-hydroxymuconate isomerase [Pseudomonas sp. 8Z]|uniref:5-carboxymethyl-2-hydroxymuconate Delta-isomerase n=1 Tax=Pseudomonas sp. 8Z TaxID=2653166 RepID=UPI0012EFB97E|nr:5-carboxymethyl-2-hydroxymuconate Delta-isomerase [Pseudomonas sp. 8Z]VXC73222.1 5-carboxymethyl-2-hydroxymuconate isomerase [Pseudomonas sp. 8Z]
MPHCLIEASAEVLQFISEDELLRLVHEHIAASGVCPPSDIKVRLSLYQHAYVAGEPGLFVHLICYVLSGRDEEQRRELSRRVVRALLERLPEVPALSMDVREMRRETFSNRRNCLEL